MRTNMGGIDRGIRAVVGVLAIVAGLYFRSWWGVIGVPLLGTALLGFCPGYVPLRISTRKT